MNFLKSSGWLTLIFSYLVLNTSQSSGPDQKKLYWISNQSGLFSHFLQLKIIYDVAIKMNRHLVIVPTGSHHYGRTLIDMCYFFDFPSSISCGNPPPDLECLVDLPLQSQDENLYFDGSKPGAITKANRFVTAASRVGARKVVLNAVENDRLKFKMSQTVLRHTDQFMEMLGIDKNKNYTVVHWRRKDQIGVRCKRGVDDSVNCGNASSLIKKVRENSDDTIVYVATNEDQNTKEMRYLRDHQFKTFFEVKFKEPFRSMSPFEVLALDVLLMMNATTFLAWGLSEMNDVIEFERMKVNRSFCIDQDPNMGDKHPTWCHAYMQRNKQSGFESELVKIE